MVAEVFAGISAFKSMLDVAKALKDMDNAASRNAAVIELQEKILAAQAQQMTLVERIGELERQVAESEKWEAEKQKYQLTDVGNGCLAFALKDEATAGTLAHHLCANCYNEGHPSILQKQERPHRREALFCQRCRNDIWPWGGGGEDEPPRPTTYSGGGAWGRARRGG